MGGGGELQSIR